MIYMSTFPGTNPLLEVSFIIPFDKVRAEHVEPAIEFLLQDARQRLEEIATEPKPRTWENTMAALDCMTERLDYAMGVVRHLEAVATYPTLRETYNKVQPLVSEFYSTIPLHEGLWGAIKSFQHRRSTPFTSTRSSTFIFRMTTAMRTTVRPAGLTL